MVGCFVIPDEPIIEPESPIICEGGSYSIHYSEWCFYTWPGAKKYPEGVFWFNENGRFFLIGDTVWPLLTQDVYGVCPERYIEEYFK